jgi:hypothetical protein
LLSFSLFLLGVVLAKKENFTTQNPQSNDFLGRIFLIAKIGFNLNFLTHKNLSRPYFLVNLLWLAGEIIYHYLLLFFTKL